MPLQGSTFTSPLVSGFHVSCVTNLGVTVMYKTDFFLNDVGHALYGQPPFPGALPPIVQPPTILLNPAALRNMPPNEKLFITGHECAHFFLPDAFKLDEANADCWSVKTGRKQGYFNAGTFKAVYHDLIASPGNWTHAPGLPRMQHILDCYNDADDGKIDRFVQ